MHFKEKKNIHYHVDISFCLLFCCVLQLRLSRHDIIIMVSDRNKIWIFICSGIRM